MAHLEDNTTDITQIAVSHQNCQKRVQQPSNEEILWWEQELKATVTKKTLIETLIEINLKDLEKTGCCI